jgi:DNA-binding FadR family transcriptional regulator
MYSQHEAIFEAIARRDSAAAQTAMEIHLATVTRYYWQAMSHGALRADQTATV